MVHVECRHTRLHLDRQQEDGIIDTGGLFKTLMPEMWANTYHLTTEGLGMGCTAFQNEVTLTLDTPFRLSGCHPLSCSPRCERLP